MVLYATVRPYLKNICIAQQNPIKESIASTAFACMECKDPLLNKYLLAVLISPWADQYVTSVQKGVAYPAVSDKDFYELLVPLPPIDEQIRICASLDQMKVLINSYEQEQIKLEKLEKEFSGKLKSSILQEAIQGKLVPQLESEPEVTQIGEVPEVVPFTIPEKWKWVSAAHVQTLVRGITFPSSAKAKVPTNNSICCLTTGSVQEKYENNADVFVNRSFMKNTRQVLLEGDVIISSANSQALVGKSILWKDDYGVKKTFGGFLTVARVKDAQILTPEYLFLIYRYMFRVGYFANLATQTTNIANLSNKLLNSLSFPVAPLEEQRRIVAKLTELLNVTRQLENSASMS